MTDAYHFASQAVVSLAVERDVARATDAGDQVLIVRP